MYRSAQWIAAVLLSAGFAQSAMAIPPGAGYYTINWGADRVQRQSWQRCADLLAPFDKYATGGHYEASDGNHNHVRLGAEIACQKGACGYCVTTMERMLGNKRIDVPRAAALAR